MPSSSFTASKLNATTFLVIEEDEYKEYPHIYVKLHPTSNVCVISDTGCDQPSERRKYDRYTHLREYLESCPLPCNIDTPLNPGGKRTYLIICTHCHYDHIGGVAQFLRGGNTSILSSASGRDFIESNLAKHSYFDAIGKPVPYFSVTHWAESFEQLKWPLPMPGQPKVPDSERKDLGITIIQTPGHTPDELAWYDSQEMHLYVGDSFYEEGEQGMPIIWGPGQGDLVEWAYSMAKLLQFVKSENAKAAAKAEASDEGEWTVVSKRVKLGCGHQTPAVDGEEILERLAKSWWQLLDGQIPVYKETKSAGEAMTWWRKKNGGRHSLSFQAPVRIVEDARVFFTGAERRGFTG